MASDATSVAGAAAPVRTSRFSRLSTVRNRQIVLVLLIVLGLVFPILDPNAADLSSLSNAAAYATLALGLNIVVGFAGLLDLGYAAFFAIGAYAYGILTSYQVTPPWSAFWVPFAALGLVAKVAQGDVSVVHFTVSFWLMLPISAIIAAGFGVAFGAPTLRLKGDYLAIVTLGFGEIVPIVFRNWTWLTNGAAGMNGIAAPTLFGHSFGVDALPYYYVGLGLVAFLIFVSFRLRESRVGRAWLAIKGDEVAAGAMGVNLMRFKLLAFAIGAGFAGMTGTFYVASLQTATPDMFNLNVSIMILVMVVLGGLGSVWGVALGAAILSLLQSWFLPQLTTWVQAFGNMTGWVYLQNVQLAQATELIFGIILVFMMLYRRQGIIPAGRRATALTFEQQHAEVKRGGIASLNGIGGPVPAEPKPLLQLSGVTVRFGGLVALKSLDLVLPEGGVVAVIGPNGSGKSTMFNVITGLTHAESGSIRFAGQEIMGLPPHRVMEVGIARTFQNIRLFPNLSVMENVLVGQHTKLHTGAVGAVLSLPRSRAEERAAREWVMEIISVFGNRLLPRVDEAAGGLSYANRRRVEISRALASRPKLLLLDEPTAGMNPAETMELAEQIKSLHTLGLSVLLIEHKLDVVTRLADKVVVLDHGEKLTEGKADEVRRNEEVLRAYLGRGAAVA